MFEIAVDKKLNFILLHGYQGSPEKNFFPWLKKELEQRGHTVTVPSLPHANKPKIEEQVNYVIKNVTFDENTIIVGHSLGGVVALKILEHLKKPIKKTILVASFCKNKFIVEPFAPQTFDWKFIGKKIKANAGEIHIMRDVTDDAVPAYQAENLKNLFGGEVFDIKAMQPHVTGEQESEVLNACVEKFPIFTTRPDTIYGVTFLVMSAQHPQLENFVTKQQKHIVENFVKKIKSTSEKKVLEKDGVFSGRYAVHPLTNEKIPIWIGNFVLADYGSGVVMAVPAHDQRDFEFAKKYNLPIKIVIRPENKRDHLPKELTKAYNGEGRLVNSQDFDGRSSKEAMHEIAEFLTENNYAKKVTHYKLKDWLVSRQRYWGTPIPIVYCETCGIVPVPEKDLPIILPEKVTFGRGNPLASNKKFVQTKCPQCNAHARRETDTMDTFFDSSWYFLRYTDSKNNKKPFEKKNIQSWLPVDYYIGGAEHACMHLIYARFFTKALRDLGYIDIDEPFTKLFNQGMLHGEDGYVMSKSRGNVILPQDVSKKHGIDTARLFLVSVAAPDKDIVWSEDGIQGSARFIEKVWKYFMTKKRKIKSSKRMESKLNIKIKEITLDIENFRYNIAIIKIRELFEIIIEEQISDNDALAFLKLLHPFCPHITEELYQKAKKKNFISLEEWPQVNEAKIDEVLEKHEQIIENTITDILNITRIIKEKQQKDVHKIFLYTLPQEHAFYNAEQLTKKVNKVVQVFAVNDKNKYDPENKAGKAKPGKPGIYVE
ncbi:MAG: alpha/beta fold hydrolase [Nanoarchaeota archaeon]